MTSPWLAIPLHAYEGHMALPAVGQAAAIADRFALLLERRRPRSVAVLGCAGGNGFDRIDAESTPRVVAIDINPAYLDAVRVRHGGRLPGLEAVRLDVERDEPLFPPVDLVFAALLLEYTDLAKSLRFMRRAVRRGGAIGIVVQLPSADIPEVTPSPFSSALASLGPAMRLIDPELVTEAAVADGWEPLASDTLAMPNGKRLRALEFRV